MERMYAGIDVGGTSIKAGMLGDNGEVLCSYQLPTNTAKGSDGILADIIAVIAQMLHQINADWSCLAGIGMGIPGMVDGTVVTGATNLGWDRLDLAEELLKYSPVPLRLANDADAAALGEVHAGAAKGMKNVFMLTLGTGLGGGIIINGDIYSGNHGYGGELAHVVLVSGGRKCCCGRRGCAEMYLSASALVKEAKTECRRYPDSTLASLDAITTKDIFDFSDTDDCCRLLAKRYTDRLSSLCLDIANAFRPEAIILGGGVSLAGAKLTEPVQRALDAHSFASAYAPKIAVIPAKLGNTAGFIGAARLWM